VLTVTGIAVITIPRSVLDHPTDRGQFRNKILSSALRGQPDTTDAENPATESATFQETVVVDTAPVTQSAIGGGSSLDLRRIPDGNSIKSIMRRSIGPIRVLTWKKHTWGLTTRFLLSQPHDSLQDLAMRASAKITDWFFLMNNL
jgi:hypothetical protein